MSSIIHNSSWWEVMGLSTESTTWYSGVAIIIQSMVFSSILSKTIQYIDRFERAKGKDNYKLMVGVISGSVISLGLLILTCSQTRILVYKRKIDAASSIRYLLLSDMVIMFFSGIFCLVAGSYYTWRCYQMTKKNRFLLAGLILALLTQMIVTIVATSYGFATPTFDAEFLANFPEYMERGHYLYKIWGGITLTVNLALSIALAFLIFWTRYGIYHYDHRRYHKYTSVAYETMLPPTLCVFILVSLGNLSGSPFTDMRRVFTVILPLLSWNSFIQTLVGRMQIRHMRDSRRRDETTNILLNDAQKNVMPMGGLNDFAGQGQGQAQGFSFKSKRGGPRVFVSPPRKL